MEIMKAIVLIGMPSSGKSSVGRRLSERLLRPFLDGDDLIRAREGMPLAEIISRRGTEGFLRIEEEALLSIRDPSAIVAPGGSAVYSPRAMEHLRSLGTVVYLRLSEEEMERRIPDFTARGVVMRGKIETPRDLYREREPLYRKYADLTIDVDGKHSEELAKELFEELKTR